MRIYFFHIFTIFGLTFVAIVKKLFTLALMGDIVFPLLISPFSNLCFFFKMNFEQKWIKHANIFFSYFYNIQLNLCSFRKETFFFRKSQLTLALMGEIVCPLLISPFSNMWFKKNILRNIETNYKKMEMAEL